MSKRNNHASGECREMREEAAGDLIPPTQERAQHDVIEPVDRIADVDGVISRPLRSIDILAAMERRGAITREMRAAGEEFRSRFHAAHLYGVKAMDLSKPLVSGGSYRHQPARSAEEDARQDVWRAVMAVGGPWSPAGSCLWNCVGWERPLKEWALRRGWGVSGRCVSQEAASGVLIAALGTLEAFYREEKKR